MENVFVLISKVPIDNLFSIALNNSIPSIFSNNPFLNFLNFLSACGLKEIISK